MSHFRIRISTLRRRYKMKIRKLILPTLILILSTGSGFTSKGAKLVEVSVVDKDYLMVHILDGEVTHRDDGIGSTAFTNQYENDRDTVKLYNPPLSTSAAGLTSSWTLKSTDDQNYAGDGLNPVQCHRKTKMNGHAQKEWSNNDFIYEYTYEHVIYLKLPGSLQEDKNYTLEISDAVNTDSTSISFVYNIFHSRSEAVRVNIVGYDPDKTMKSADLYIWMGDGGARDYSSFEGNKVYIYDVTSNQSTDVGTVSFWKKNRNDVGGHNLIWSDVWNADFAGFSTKGTYRLAIEGVGCSQDFTIDNKVYYGPFKVSVQGFFYMRIGQDSTGGIYPVPRRPLFIPGKSPSNTRVYLTTMHPYHSEWSTFSSGDVWDKPNDWVKYCKDGNPLNPNAIGGHSDALDWDRHLGHISIIYDMLLPFILTNGAIDDDDLDIAESGNGIPDILDEARNEVDFWLNLRDGQGYSHGLTNPNDGNQLFQAAPTAVAAWANAANAAMLSNCFQIAGKTELMNVYRDSAIAAYDYAGSLSDQMLDKTQNIGESVIRGRDLKMMAAAFLYNVTGETKYEDAIAEESVVKNSTSELENYGTGNTTNQLYATAGYLMTPQEIHYPDLYANMKASIIFQAKDKETDYIPIRPSRRATNGNTGYFRTIQNLQHTIIAHAVADQQTDKDLFRRAMVLEADYGLGRNPMNMIQMTTASSILEGKRSVINAYTSGADDGAPGMHPGHTPYFNLDDWYCDMVMGCPSKLYENCYPADFKRTWPADEGYFNTRYVWAHNEFTPQQTMRGKTALYGYLYALGKNGGTSVIRHRKPVQSGLAKQGKTLVRIHDLAGRVIWSGNREIEPQDISRLLPAKGVFLLEKMQNGKRQVRRILKH